MKLLNLIFLFIILGTCQLSSQSNSVYEYATARVDKNSSRFQPHIHVVYPTGETEAIELEMFATSEAREAGGKSLQETRLENQIRLTNFLNGMAGKGYELYSSDMTIDGHSGKHAFFVFRIGKKRGE